MAFSLDLSGPVPERRTWMTSPLRHGHITLGTPLMGLERDPFP